MTLCFIKKTIFVIGITWLMASCAYATNIPIKLAKDARIEVVNFNKMNVVPIHGMTFVATQIVFAKNEVIVDVQNGDLGAWTTSINKDLPNMLFIKPTAFNSHTNMTVITNKHTYYFALTSNTDGQKIIDPTYAVHFEYPHTIELKALAAIRLMHKKQDAKLIPFNDPRHYNWDYSYHGDKSILPFQIFDDGKFTYFQFKPNESIPAIFAVNTPSGQESIVNYRIVGHYVVVERTAPQFTLRLGDHQVASIFNNKLVAKMKTASFDFGADE